MNHRPASTSTREPRKPDRKLPAVIYLRSAQTKDAERELAHQDRVCRRRADAFGLFVVQTCRDLAGGSLQAERPGWRTVEAMIRAGQIRAVVAADFTRITDRWDDVNDVMRLRRDYDVLFVTGDRQ